MERLDIDIPEGSPTTFDPKIHVEYIKTWNENKSELEYVASEYLRMSGLYWCVTALNVMGSPEVLNREELLQFVDECYDEASGGFGANVDNDPHILYTLSAVQLLCMLKGPLDKYKAGIRKFVRGLEQDDGSFMGDKWGEIDTRFSFCAVATLSLIHHLEDINVAKAANYVLGCLNFDGGFGVGPESETHAGQIYCCVSTLSITGDIHRINRKKLGFWLSRRQLQRSGGLNGRPEKLPDVCYSWWILSSLITLGCERWIDRKRLREFIVACQDLETGGFADRPGDHPDPFHTLFGTAALSMLGESCLNPIDSVYCMPKSVVESIFHPSE